MLVSPHLSFLQPPLPSSSHHTSLTLLLMPPWWPTPWFSSVLIFGIGSADYFFIQLHFIFLDFSTQHSPGFLPTILASFSLSLCLPFFFKLLFSWSTSKFWGTLGLHFLPRWPHYGLMILNTGFVPVTQIYALSLELQNQVKLTCPRYLIDIALYLTDSTLTWSKRICDSLPFLTLESFVSHIALGRKYHHPLLCSSQQDSLSQVLP